MAWILEHCTVLPTYVLTVCVCAWKRERERAVGCALCPNLNLGRTQPDQWLGFGSVGCALCPNQASVSRVTGTIWRTMLGLAVLNCTHHDWMTVAVRLVACKAVTFCPSIHFSVPWFIVIKLQQNPPSRPTKGLHINLPSKRGVFVQLDKNGHLSISFYSEFKILKVVMSKLLVSI